jgi:hypothetical protein
MSERLEIEVTPEMVEAGAKALADEITSIEAYGEGLGYAKLMRREITYLVLRAVAQTAR